VKNDDFNKIYAEITGHTTIVFVVPHYALVPSKLLAVLEKMDELSYLAYCQNRAIDHGGRTVCVIAHGGLTGDCAETYKNNILDPLCCAFRNLGFRILNEKTAVDLCFGTREYLPTKSGRSTCFDKVDDTESIGRIVAAATELLRGDPRAHTDKDR
jgi:hypothetical protein